nr:thioester domain-containing protein [Lacticaseibacillus manihotivorans]
MIKTARRTSILAALIVMLVQLLVPASMALAASMTNVLATNWVTGWKLKAFNNSSWTDNGIWMKQIDGGKQIAFCVEHGVDLDMSGSEYTPSSYSNAKKERLAEIAYYGYYSQPSAKNYAVTQMMVWEELGDTLVSNPYSAYVAEKKAILAKVSAHDKKPSFNGQQVTLAIGDSITLTDTNGRLAAFAQQTANTANLKITKSGNKLTLTLPPSLRLPVRWPMQSPRPLTLVPLLFIQRVPNKSWSTSSFPATANSACRSRST